MREVLVHWYIPSFSVGPRDLLANPKSLPVIIYTKHSSVNRLKKKKSYHRQPLPLNPSLDERLLSFSSPSVAFSM